jgi:UrcA family protein
MTRSIRALLVGLALVGVATTASASQREVVALNKTLVRYGDLNLRNDASAATLLGRLSRAANKVCAVESRSPANAHPRNEELACRETALRNAVVTVDHPVLTALYQSTRADARMKLASR